MPENGPVSERRIHWGSDELPTGPLVVWRGKCEVRYVPAAEVERLRESLHLVAQGASLNVTSRIAALTLQGYSTEELRNAL